ncbi:MAG: hypothetical protein ABFS30_02060, partial [Pseudomonadota bacterium]
MPADRRKYYDEEFRVGMLCDRADSPACGDTPGLPNTGCHEHQIAEESGHNWGPLPVPRHWRFQQAARVGPAGLLESIILVISMVALVSGN